MKKSVLVMLIICILVQSLQIFEYIDFRRAFKEQNTINSIEKLEDLLRLPLDDRTVVTYIKPDAGYNEGYAYDTFILLEVGRNAVFGDSRLPLSADDSFLINGVLYPNDNIDYTSYSHANHITGYAQNSAYSMTKYVMRYDLHERTAVIIHLCSNVPFFFDLEAIFNGQENRNALLKGEPYG
jgi:hypothetical protein